MNLHHNLKASPEVGGSMFVASTTLHGVISQKTVFFIVIVVEPLISQNQSLRGPSYPGSSEFV
jgi:hypothetical protein